MALRCRGVGAVHNIKTRRTQTEHNTSALHLFADMQANNDFRRSGPIADMAGLDVTRPAALVLLLLRCRNYIWATISAIARISCTVWGSGRCHFGGLWLYRYAPGLQHLHSNKCLQRTE